ncbi:hypothetical protein L9F63_002862, partial [Diploptera punctata]
GYIQWELATLLAIGSSADGSFLMHSVQRRATCCQQENHPQCQLRSGGQSAESAAGSAAWDRRPTGMLRGSFPKYYQLLGQEQRGDAAGW